jgi:hypothetical protein
MMGPECLTLPSITLRMSSLAATKEAFAENLKRVHWYQAIKVPFWKLTILHNLIHNYMDG